MSSLADVLHKVVNYLPWRNESELTEVRDIINKVDDEIRSFIGQPAGVTTPADAERATKEVTPDVTN